MSDWPVLRLRVRLWINPERTVLVRLWPHGTVEVAFRPDTGRHWGEPIVLLEESVRPPDENPRYGPGNPDWEHDRAKDDT